MTWASQRRTLYIAGVIAFFLVVVGVPVAYWYFSTPATCSDGIQNQGETGVDVGGPCLTLDARALQPYAVLWTRSFRVRDGLYNAVAYIQNPNSGAGVPAVSYTFSLYDSQNILIAERQGTTFIMPGGVTPIFESAIDTGNRIVAHTYFEFTDPLVWKKMQDTASAISIDNKQIADVSTAPRVTAQALNTSVNDIVGPSFVAIVFDPSGNAFAASQTSVTRFVAGTSALLTFTWPEPFGSSVGRVDIVPVSAPVLAR